MDRDGDVVVIIRPEGNCYTPLRSVEELMAGYVPGSSPSCFDVVVAVEVGPELRGRYRPFETQAQALESFSGHEAHLLSRGNQPFPLGPQDLRRIRTADRSGGRPVHGLRFAMHGRPGLPGYTAYLYIRERPAREQS